ncbi:MAG: PQQ-like beta-propeller repeat protein, partial [Lactococcus sp.]|nr:PQQ-like beta-propeller repeat protein [Lactococcus sp.]
EFSGKKIEFPNEIEEIKQNNEYLFIRLAIIMNSPVPIKDEDNNVYAIDKNGNVVWQIKNIPPEDNEEFICSPIVLMYVDDNNRLFVTDFSGRRFKVNLETGGIEITVITK